MQIEIIDNYVKVTVSFLCFKRVYYGLIFNDDLRGLQKSNGKYLNKTQSQRINDLYRLKLIKDKFGG